MCYSITAISDECVGDCFQGWIHIWCAHTASSRCVLIVMKKRVTECNNVLFFWLLFVWSPDSSFRRHGWQQPSAKPHGETVGIQHWCVRIQSPCSVLKVRSCWRHLWFFFSDHGHWIRQTLWPQEGHERNLQGEIPPHQTDTQQD